MDSEELLNRALHIAVEAFLQQVDKMGAFYLRHVFRVVERCATQDAKIVAALHDVLEDHADLYPRERLEGLFPPHILRGLECVTKSHEDEPYYDFISRVLENPLAMEVKLADLEDNLDVRRLLEVTAQGAARISKYLEARQRILIHMGRMPG